jgi:hypothetical protein
MKIDFLLVLGVIAVAGVVGFASCRQKTETPGPAEKAGAALDKAAANTVEAANTAAAKTKEAAQKVTVKTGEGLEKAGAAVEKTGENLQK